MLIKLLFFLQFALNISKLFQRFIWIVRIVALGVLVCFSDNRVLWKSQVAYRFQIACKEGVWENPNQNRSSIPACCARMTGVAKSGSKVIGFKIALLRYFWEEMNEIHQSKLEKESERNLFLEIWKQAETWPAVSLSIHIHGCRALFDRGQKWTCVDFFF